MAKYAIKALDGDRGKLRSAHDGSLWENGIWREVAGDIAPCWNGFHCFHREGLTHWVNWSDSLAVVEVAGTHVAHGYGSDRKHVYRKMRVVNKIRLTRKLLRQMGDDLGVREAVEDALYWYTPRESLTTDVLQDIAYQASGEKIYDYLMDNFAPKEEGEGWRLEEPQPK